MLRELEQVVLAAAELVREWLRLEGKVEGSGVEDD